MFYALLCYLGTNDAVDSDHSLAMERFNFCRGGLIDRVVNAVNPLRHVIFGSRAIVIRIEKAVPKLPFSVKLKYLVMFFSAGLVVFFVSLFINDLQLTVVN
jgi:hypothetical protein